MNQWLHVIRHAGLGGLRFHCCYQLFDSDLVLRRLYTRYAPPVVQAVRHAIKHGSAQAGPDQARAHGDICTEGMQVLKAKR